MPPFRPARHILAALAALAVSFSAPLLAQTPHTRPQAAPLSGTFQPDPAIPTLIAPAQQGNGYFVLNQDLSLSGRYYPPNAVCPPPAGFSASSTTPRTLLADFNDAYITAQSTGANAGASTIEPGNPCLTAPIVTFPGGTPTQTLSANDHGLNYLYVLNAFAGNGPDTFTVLRPDATSTGLALKPGSTTNLDTNAVYTSVVPDTNAFGLVAITSLKTATSPGNLFVYSSGINTAFKILGPGGAPLPAVTSFIIPNSANDNGGLLILVNQDNRTAANSQSPPAVASPITIIDLGQLSRAMAAVVSQGTTIQLDNIRQIRPIAPYYGILGAVYSPVFHSVYILASIANGSGGFTQNIIRYDLQDPSAPNETIVADVSSISIPFGSTPQLTLDSTEGTLYLLNPSDKTLYRIVVAGKNNTPTVVTGTPFPDSNFKPTYIASNTLLGETYIASSTQVDILNRSATALPRATVELYGLDYAIVGQTYSLRLATRSPQYDAALDAAPLTVTATPQGGGTPLTLYTGTVHDFYPGYSSSKSVTFAAPGVYTLVASVPAAGAYPAFSSLPARVSVGASAIAPIYPTTLILSLPATSTSTSVTASLILRGSTYAPTGTILITDAGGTQVGRYNFTQGATNYPISVPLTLPSGLSTLTATYDGKYDTQNQPSTSAPISITVNPVTAVTPTLTLGLPASAAPGSTVTGTITFASSSTSAPTGNIEIDVVPNMSTTPTVIFIPAAQAFVAGGKSFTFTAPTTPGGATVFASYKGDPSYNLAYSQSSTLNIAPATLITTTTSLSAVATATAGTPFPVTVRFSQATPNSTAPTGFITVQATNTAGSVTILGTVTIAQATASGGYALQSTLTNPGTYSITATYNGDSLYSPSSGTISVNVTAAKGTITLSNIYIPANVVSGTKISGNVSIASTGNTAAPTGNYVLNALSSTGTSVTLATIPAATVTGSTINFTFTAPAAGRYTAQVTYAGDTSFDPATSNSINFVVGAFNTPTLSLSAVATATAGTPFLVSVRLTNPSTTNTPSGDITLTATPAGGSPITLTTISAFNALAVGGFQYTATLPVAANYTLIASYAGDPYFAAVTSNIGVNVKALLNLVDVFVPAGEPQGGTITGTLTTSISGASAAVPSGNIIITAVHVSDGVSTVLATIPASQTATKSRIDFMYPVPDARGIYRVTADYAGDANFASSNFSFINFNVVAAIFTSTSLTATAPPTVSVLTSFSGAVALLSKYSLATLPTGNITLTYVVADGRTFNLITGQTLSAASAISPGGVGFTGYIEELGKHTITVTYAGDANYAPSSTTFVLNVTVSPTSIALTGPATGTTGTPLTYNAILSNFNSQATGTSGVTLTSTVNGAAGPQAFLPRGTTSAALTFINNGTYTITASYLGDAFNAPSTAQITTVITGGPLADYVLKFDDPAAATTPVQLTKTTQVDVPFTLSAVNGFSGTTILSAAFQQVGGGGQSTASESNYVLVDDKGNQLSTGNGIHNVVITPTTGGVHLRVRVHGENFMGALQHLLFRKPSAIAFAGLFLGFGLFGWRKRRFLSPRLAQVLLVFAVVAASGTVMAGCGAGSYDFRVTLTAVPAVTGAGTTQAISFDVHYIR